MENDNYKLENLKRREMKLAGLRDRILKLPAEKIVDAILDYEMPGSLVQSIPKEDLYFLIHDIGPEDSLPILALADGKQWEYLLDLEIWQKDRIDLPSLTKWFELLYHADKYRLVNWLVRENTELFEFCLNMNIEVRIREEDEDPSEFGDEYFTVDDIYYVRFRNDISDNSDLDEETKDYIQNSRDIFEQIIYLMADIDHIIYQQVLLESTSIIPSESEEQIYRLKNVRLAEKGFMPYDAAVSVYSPVEVGALKKSRKKVLPSGLDEDKVLPTLPVAYEFDPHGIYFKNALSAIESQEILNYIRVEFASLCNQMISADQQKIRTKEELVLVLEKAGFYLSIGLEVIAEEEGNDPSSLAKFITHYPLIKIFRLGYGKAMTLKFRAEKWVKKSWFKSNGLPIGFWGELFMGFLGGLLLKRPMYFDNYESGLLYREFHSLSEIKKTEAILDELSNYDDLFSLLHMDLKKFTSTYLTHKNMLLTLWACSFLKIEDTRPLILSELRTFFSGLWAKDKQGEGLRVDEKMKTSFLSWLSGETGLTRHEISVQMARTLETLFSEIESEYGHVKAEDLNPRYIHLFCMEKKRE